MNNAWKKLTDSHVWDMGKDQKVYALNEAGNIREAHIGELSIGDLFATRKDLEPPRPKEDLLLDGGVAEILQKIDQYTIMDSEDKTKVWIGLKKIEVSGQRTILEMAQYISDMGGLD